MRLRIRWTTLVGALLAAPFLLALPAAAQSSEVLLPEQSAAKAKELIQKTIQALGGQAYLGVRDSTCSGRLAIFDRHGETGGYARFWDFNKYPDKNRTEYYKQRNQITVFNGDKGWEMDRGGVQDAPADSVAQFQESQKKDLDALFRFHLKDEGMIFRYGGPDLVDLKQVDWVEIVDRDHRTFRIAIDRATSLPLQLRIITRDSKSRERVEETYFFSNYHAVQGVQTPLQVARERNGSKVYQVFFEECQYNTGLADSFFTRESLEQRFAELNKGKKKDKDKEKAKQP